MNIQRNTSMMMLGGAILATQLGFAGNHSKEMTATKAESVWRAPATSSQLEISSLLESVQADAMAVSRSAGLLMRYIDQPGRFDWRSHAFELSVSSEHVNRMGQSLRRLENLKADALPWQRLAMDRVIPAAAMLARQTNSAIAQLRESRRYLFAPEYRKSVSSIYAGAGDIRNMIDTKLEYVDARKALDMLSSNTAAGADSAVTGGSM